MRPLKEKHTLGKQAAETKAEGSDKRKQEEEKQQLNFL